MVIYGVMTETNIGKLFAAGILPGILATFLLCLAVQWTVWTDPGLGSARRTLDLGGAAAARSRACGRVALLFIVVMGGIYGGVFTATEGAGIGAFGALCFALGAARADLAHAARRAGRIRRAPRRCCSPSSPAR